MKVKRFLCWKQNLILQEVLIHAPRYLTASSINAGVGVLMNKYYTYVFSPAEFGVLALYVAFCQYLQNLLMLTIDGAAQRVYFEYKNVKIREFFGTIVLFSLGSLLFWFIIGMIIQQHVMQLLGGTSYMYYVTILLAFLITFTNFLARIANNENLSTLILKQGLLQTAVNHGGSFFLIGCAGTGLLGRQLGQLVAYCVSLFGYMVALMKTGIWQFAFTFRIEVFKRLAHFALPSFLSIVVVASLSYLDRVLLNYYHGAAQVGIYSLGLIIGQSLSLVIEAVGSALFPVFMRALEQNYEGGLNKIKQCDLLFCGSLFALGGIVFFLKDWLIAILSNQAYATAGAVIPYILAAYIAGGCYKSVAIILSFRGIVWFLPKLSAISFGIPAAMNFWLIPHYNEVGAAYSFFLSSFLYSAGMNYIGAPYYWKLSRVGVFYGAFFVIVTTYFIYQVG